ncbi:MAG: hypothetical protein IPG96_14420 [Proteobacteria bacterium]|nr:hypothetical protein [Pseudomonadota bacterium]
MTTTRHRRLIRNYLLDRRLQLRYTLVVVLVSAGLSAGLGYFWYGEMRQASQIVEVQVMGSLDEQGARQIQQDLARQDQRRLIVLVGFGVALAVALAGYSIVFTHKVAGPLHKMQRAFAAMRDGHLPEVHDLRRHDQLRAFWAAFKEMYVALRDQTQQELEELDQIAACLGAEASAEQRQQAVDRLTALRERKRAALTSEV